MGQGGKTELGQESRGCHKGQRPVLRTYHGQVEKTDRLNISERKNEQGVRSSFKIQYFDVLKKYGL